MYLLTTWKPTMHNFTSAFPSLAFVISFTHLLLHEPFRVITMSLKYLDGYTYSKLCCFAPEGRILDLPNFGAADSDESQEMISRVRVPEMRVSLRARTHR